jgi:hypothetical protein
MKLVSAFSLCKRPVPTADLLSPEGALTDTPIQPDAAQQRWTRATFIDPARALTNSDHAHRLFATIGTPWAAIPNAEQMRAVSARPSSRLSAVASSWMMLLQMMPRSRNRPLGERGVRFDTMLLPNR